MPTANASARAACRRFGGCATSASRRLRDVGESRPGGTVTDVGKGSGAPGLAAIALVGALGGGRLSSDGVGAAQSPTVPATTTTSTTVPGTPAATAAPVERSSDDADEPLCVTRRDPPEGTDTSEAPSQITLEREMSVVNTYGVPLGEEFHGAGMTWTDDGRRVVIAAFVANVAEHREALVDLVDDPDHVMVCRARLTRSEGAAIVADVQPRLAEFENAFGPNGMDGRVDVNILAGHDATAEMLNAEYGDQLDVSLGAFPYPMPDPLPEPVCPDLPDTNPDLPLAAESPSPVAVAAGDGVHASVGVPFVNATAERIAFGSGYPSVYLADPDTGDVVGVPNANFGIEAVGVPVDLEPGAAFDGSVSVPTAACDPSTGHTLPPGDYDLFAVYSVVTATVNITEGDFAVGPIPISIIET